MKLINLKTTEDKFLISIDRSAMDKESLMRLIENIQMELLAQEANIDPSVVEIGAEIKSSWWDKNKEEF
ncbi:MAG: hypothetical protein R2879_17090 [Saprospiraceae bacterium]